MTHSGIDARWQIPYRIITSDKKYYVQVIIGKEWHTLSSMINTGHSYKFCEYRNWTDIKGVLQWWKQANWRKILISSVWMPSKALYNIEIVSDYIQVLEDYPEVLI